MLSWKRIEITKVIEIMQSNNKKNIDLVKNIINGNRNKNIRTLCCIIRY